MGNDEIIIWDAIGVEGLNGGDDGTVVSFLRLSEAEIDRMVSDADGNSEYLPNAIVASDSFLRKLRKRYPALLFDLSGRFDYGSLYPAKDSWCMFPNGGRYTLPISSEPVFMYYSKPIREEILDEADMEGLTWETFIGLSEELIEYGIKPIQPLSMLAKYVLGTANLEPYGEDGSFAVPDVSETASLLLELWNRGIVAPESASGWQTVASMLRRGEMFAVIAPYWFSNILFGDDLDEDVPDIGYARVPKDQAHSRECDCGGISISFIEGPDAGNAVSSFCSWLGTCDTHTDGFRDSVFGIRQVPCSPYDGYPSYSDDRFEDDIAGFLIELMDDIPFSYRGSADGMLDDMLFDAVASSLEGDDGNSISQAFQSMISDSPFQFDDFVFPISMSVCSAPLKTDYYVHEAIDLDGIDISVLFSDGSERHFGDLPNDGDDLTVPTVTFTLSMNGSTVSCGLDIRLTQRTPLSLSVRPLLRRYPHLDAFTNGDFEVLVLYDAGLPYRIGDFSIAPQSAISVGEMEIFVFASGMTEGVTVEVVPVPVSIRVTRLPRRRTYGRGEGLSMVGMAATVLFSDGSERTCGMGELTFSMDTAPDSLIGLFDVDVTYRSAGHAVTTRITLERADGYGTPGYRIPLRLSEGTSCLRSLDGEMVCVATVYEDSLTGVSVTLKSWLENGVQCCDIPAPVEMRLEADGYVAILLDGTVHRFNKAGRKTVSGTDFSASDTWDMEIDAITEGGIRLSDVSGNAIEMARCGSRFVVSSIIPFTPFGDAERDLNAISYGYDGGRLASVSSGDGLSILVTRDGDGRPTGLTVGYPGCPQAVLATLEYSDSGSVTVSRRHDDGGQVLPWFELRMASDGVSFATLGDEGTMTRVTEGDVPGTFTLDDSLSPVTAFRRCYGGAMAIERDGMRSVLTVEGERVTGSVTCSRTANGEWRVVSSSSYGYDVSDIRRIPMRLATDVHDMGQTHAPVINSHPDNPWNGFGRGFEFSVQTAYPLLEGVSSLLLMWIRASEDAFVTVRMSMGRIHYSSCPKDTVMLVSVPVCPNDSVSMASDNGITVVAIDCLSVRDPLYGRDEAYDSEGRLVSYWEYDTLEKRCVINTVRRDVNGMVTGLERGSMMTGRTSVSMSYENGRLASRTVRLERDGESVESESSFAYDENGYLVSVTGPDGITRTRCRSGRTLTDAEGSETVTYSACGGRPVLREKDGRATAVLFESPFHMGLSCLRTDGTGSWESLLSYDFRRAPGYGTSNVSVGGSAIESRVERLDRDGTSHLSAVMGNGWRTETVASHGQLERTLVSETDVIEGWIRLTGTDGSSDTVSWTDSTGSHGQTRNVLFGMSGQDGYFPSYEDSLTAHGHTVRTLYRLHGEDNRSYKSEMCLDEGETVTHLNDIQSAEGSTTLARICLSGDGLTSMRGTEFAGTESVLSVSTRVGTVVTVTETETDGSGRTTGRLKRKSTGTTSSDGPVLTDSIDYDEMGRVSEYHDAFGSTHAYHYDGYGQLLSETDSGSGMTLSMQYDAMGNVVSITRHSDGFQDGMVLLEYSTASDVQSGYPVAGMLKAVNGMPVTYDMAGNPVSYRQLQVSWKGRLPVSIGNVVMEYDGFGRRIAKGDRHYLYSPDGILMECPADGTGHVIRYERDCDGSICGLNVDGEWHVLARNSLGDICAILSAEGLLECRYSYDAWGNCKAYDSLGNLISSDADHIANVNPLRYRGYYYDVETGLYWLSSRYYDPEIGRFISPDSVDYLDPTSINGLNLYAYCNNDPVNYADPSGRFPVATLLIATLIGAAIGTAIEVGKQIYDGGNWNWDLFTWNYWEIGKGALIGAALGLAYGLGGIAGGIVRGSVKALTIAGKALTVSRSVGVLLGVAASTSFIAGFGGYALHTAGTPEDDFNVFKGISEGLGQSVKGLLSFGTGGMFGGSGVWKFGQDIPVGKQIVNAMYRGTARFAANYIPNYVIDGIF